MPLLFTAKTAINTLPDALDVDVAVKLVLLLRTKYESPELLLAPIKLGAAGVIVKLSWPEFSRTLSEFILLPKLVEPPM